MEARLLILLLIVVPMAYATPAITGISGTIAHGQTITITGSGFGTKSPVAPMKWDPVDGMYPGLTNGQRIPVGNSYPWPAAYQDIAPYYKTQNPRGLWTAKYSNNPSTINGAAHEKAALGGIQFPQVGHGVMYTTWWNWISTDGTLSNSQNKFTRFTPTGYWEIATVIWSPDHSSGYDFSRGYTLDAWHGEEVTRGAWNRMEKVIDNSYNPSPRVRLSVNNKEFLDCYSGKSGCDSGGATVGSLADIDGIAAIGWMPEFDFSADSATFDFGEIYVDNTLSRVEICNANTKSGSDHCEIQLPQNTWNSNQVQIKVNQGSFPSGQAAYLYVVDSNGAVNQNGYPLSLGGTSSSSGPAISSASGTLSSGSSITVTGSNFGTGDTTPLLWDDFERGTDQASLPAAPKAGTWTLNAGGPKYTIAQKHAGSLSATSDYADGNGFINIEWEPMSHATGATYYQSYWFRYNSPTDGNCDQSYHCGQTKLTQLWGSYRQNDYSPGVMTGGFAGDWWATYIALENAGSYQQDSYQDTPIRNTWHQFEMYIRQSDANVANGRVTILIDGKEIYGIDPVKTREMSGHGWDFTTFFDGMTNWGAHTQTWVDNVYLSDTWAHVELGNTATFASSTIHEIQMPTAWTGSSITFAANLGSFTSGQTAYLYIMDSNGKVNANGYPVTIGSGSTSACGNGIKEGSEQCDDSNTVTETCPNGQTSCTVCSSTCLNVSGATNFCGDTKCNSGETCSSCSTDCGACTCSPDWVCSAWSACANSQQTRTCTDSNSCGTTTVRPALTQACGSNEIIVDNRHASVSKQGAWESSSFYPGFYGADYEYSYSSADWFEWNAAIQPGTYNVYAWWQAFDGRPTAAKYSIAHASGTSEVTVDQQQNGGKWNLLGTYSFASIAKVRLSATNPGGQGICADAIRFVKSTHAADTDSNCCITMAELSVYMNQWKSGTTIQLSNLMEAIRIWKQGC